MERFKKEILGSECFDRVRSFIKNFDDFIEKKIVLIKGRLKQIDLGDLCADNLGISQEDKEYLINNVNVVLNCAASVDFNQRLDEAI
jgi:fatty acyl-CoA reductase